MHGGQTGGTGVNVSQLAGAQRDCSRANTCLALGLPAQQPGRPSRHLRRPASQQRRQAAHGPPPALHARAARGSLPTHRHGADQEAREGEQEEQYKGEQLQQRAHGRTNGRTERNI